MYINCKPIHMDGCSFLSRFLVMLTLKKACFEGNMSGQNKRRRKKKIQLNQFPSNSVYLTYNYGCTFLSRFLVMLILKRLVSKETCLEKNKRRRKKKTHLKQFRFNSVYLTYNFPVECRLSRQEQITMHSRCTSLYVSSLTKSTIKRTPWRGR